MATACPRERRAQQVQQCPLATGSNDGRMTLWDLTELSALRRESAEYACSVVGRGLSRDEWVRYISGLPYESTCPQ